MTAILSGAILTVPTPGYDWAAEAEDEYGLSEFLVANGSEVEVAYTAATEEMLSMLANGSWLPEAADRLQDAA